MVSLERAEHLEVNARNPDLPATALGIDRRLVRRSGRRDLAGSVSRRCHTLSVFVAGQAVHPCAMGWRPKPIASRVRTMCLGRR